LVKKLAILISFSECLYILKHGDGMLDN